MFSFSVVRRARTISFREGVGRLDLVILKREGETRTLNKNTNTENARLMHHSIILKSLLTTVFFEPLLKRREII